jgi:hypothetical protein
MAKQKGCCICHLPPPLFAERGERKAHRHFRLFIACNMGTVNDDALKERTDEEVGQDKKNPYLQKRLQRLS